MRTLLSQLDYFLMGQSPLKIESYYLKKLNYQLKRDFESGVPDGTPEKVEPKIQVNVQTGHREEDKNDWRVEIDVHGGDEGGFPYTFDISFVGFFRVNARFPEDKRELLISVNGPSILFAAARELVSIVTGRSPYPPILLPSISFVPEKKPEKSPKRPPKSAAKKSITKSPKKKALKK